jgi:ketosteroid isomerase-like protein
MKQVAPAHDDAMRLADEAFVAQLRGDAAAATELLHKAFELERQAAELLAGDFNLEPTRSVLFRSAATLAQRCGEHAEAERLIAQGLAGRPPREIADELDALRRTIRAAHE